VLLKLVVPSITLCSQFTGGIFVPSSTQPFVSADSDLPEISFRLPSATVICTVIKILLIHYRVGIDLYLEGNQNSKNKHEELKGPTVLSGKVYLHFV